MAVDKSDQNGPYQVLMTFVERSPLWTASLVSPLKSVAEAVNVASSLSVHPPGKRALTSLWLGISNTIFQQIQNHPLHFRRYIIH